MNFNHNLTETDSDKIDFLTPLKQQIKGQKIKESGWQFDKIISMTIYVYKTDEMKGSNYVKQLLGFSALLNIETDDMYCFLRSIWAKLRPCNNSYPYRVSNYRQYFNDLYNQDFDFSNRFEYSDIHWFLKLTNLSIKTFELGFYHEEKKT